MFSQFIYSDWLTATYVAVFKKQGAGKKNGRDIFYKELLQILLLIDDQNYTEKPTCLCEGLK